MACNAARLRACDGVHRFKVICETWTKNPERYTINLHHLIPEPYKIEGAQSDHLTLIWQTLWGYRSAPNGIMNIPFTWRRTSDKL